MRYFQIVVMVPFIIVLAFCLVGPAYGVCDEHCSQCEADRCIACKYGYWGHACTKDCMNCSYGGCTKESGRCLQCKPGYFGEHCKKHCPDNCWSSVYKDRADCRRHTGMCLEGCYQGWWGDQCKNSCFAGCEGACYQHDGACVSDCKKGLFGRFCNITCSLGCAGETCDWLTGDCSGGCKCGYTGDKCEDTCSINCNTPCKFDDKSQCLTCVNICDGHCRAGRCYQNGSCVDGCQADFYGEQCLRSCPLDCSTSKREPGCSCIGEKPAQGDLHSSVDVLTIVVREDEVSESKLDVDIQLNRGGLVRRISGTCILLISCLLWV